MKKLLLITILAVFLIGSLAFTSVGLINEINEVRTDYGIVTLNHSLILDDFAEYRLSKVDASVPLKHPDNYRKDFEKFLRINHLKDIYGRGEIIARSTKNLNINDYIQGWLTSPPHRKAMLDGMYTDVGYCMSNINEKYVIVVEFMGKVKN